MTTQPQGLPANLIAKIKERDIRNIAQRASDGRPLSREQLQRLEDAEQVSDPENTCVVIEPGMIGADSLAGVLGLTARRIRQLVAEGVIARAGRGHCLWPDAVQQYCDYLRGGGDSKDSLLKRRQLELQCKRLEQNIREYTDVMRDEIRAQFSAVMADCWAEYRQMLNRATAMLTPKQRDELNACATRAAELSAERFEAESSQNNAPQTAEQLD